MGSGQDLLPLFRYRLGTLGLKSLSFYFNSISIGQRNSKKYKIVSANQCSTLVASDIPWNIIHIVTPKWDVCGKFTFQRVPLQLGHLGALIFIFSEITM